MQELFDRLKDELGVTETQARRGSAALFKAAQERMKPADFEELLADVPGVRETLKEAPQNRGGGGLIGGLASVIGGQNSDIAQAARILSAFGSLNMGKEEIFRFVPIVVEYLKTHGGESLEKQLRAALRL